MALVCLWISLDLEGYLATLQPTLWSWIAVKPEFAESFIILTRVSAVVLIAIVVSEIVVYVYAESRVDAFAEETLKRLSR